MTDKELSIVLRELARSQQTPLCEKWTDEWKDDSSVDVLLDKFVRGQDFCIKNNYPTLDFIRKNFRLEDLHRHNIYLDEEVDLDANDSGYYIFLGNCKGELRVRGFSVVTCYVRHSSRMSIASLDSARVFVTYYEQSDGDTRDCEWSKIRVYDKRKKGED